MSTRDGITGRSRVVGVWGHPVAHSRSPRMQNAALAQLGLDWVYVPFDVDPECLPAAVAGIRALDLVGVNVTVPLKERIVAHLDSVDPMAARIGSVNTIHNVRGELRGYSTDGPGFLRAAQAMGWPVDGLSILLLGAGGSARALAFTLAERGNRLTIANRSSGRAEELAAAVNAAFPRSIGTAAWGAAALNGPVDMVINTTSVGMHPRESEAPMVPGGAMGMGVYVYDLIYAPDETLFLKQARDAGCIVSNGLGMLVQQGALSLSLWSGVPVERLPVEIMESAARVSDAK